MNTNQILAVIVIVTVALSFGDFVRNPEKYGEIMRRFDEARYGVEITE